MMLIAVEGCAHGELEKIYDTIQLIEREQNLKVDLLICCGDFQSVRNVADLQCMAVPEKYLSMCSFYKYYSGEKTAPILTLFIGGNHEASNYLQELPYGGWVAPKIYYLGYAGVVNFGGVRIAGLSGIYKGGDYLKGHYEIPPYTEATKRSAYHVRNLEVFRLRQLSGEVDIMLSHDWPRGIYNHGNKAQLARFKPHFKQEMEENKLGNRPCEELLDQMKPKFWFSAHLHAQFAALIQHKDDDKMTRFLALDKCLPKRRFLQILRVNGVSDGTLEHDREWLAILKATNHLLSVKQQINYMPGPGYPERWNFTPTKKELSEIDVLFNAEYKIPNNFVKTACPFDGKSNVRKLLKIVKAEATLNKQTECFCNKLGVDDPIDILVNGKTKPKTRVSLSDFVNKAEMEVTQNEGEITQVSFQDTQEEENSETSQKFCSTPLIPSRSPFILPKPKFDSPLAEVDSPLSTNSSSLPEKRLSDDTPASPSKETLVKKFKRRNISLYTDEEV